MDGEHNQMRCRHRTLWVSGEPNGTDGSTGPHIARGVACVEEGDGKGQDHQAGDDGDEPTCGPANLCFPGEGQEDGEGEEPHREEGDE